MNEEDNEDSKDNDRRGEGGGSGDDDEVGKNLLYLLQIWLGTDVLFCLAFVYNAFHSPVVKLGGRECDKFDIWVIWVTGKNL